MQTAWKHRLGTKLVLLLLVAILAACSDNTSNTSKNGGSGSTSSAESAGQERPFEGQTLHIYLVSHPWGESIKKLAPEFEAATGIKLDFQSFFDEQFAQKISVQLTTQSSTPDVFMYRPPQEGKLFFNNGWMEPLDEYVKRDPAYDFADFSESSINSATVDGVLTGIPLYTEAQILYYRKDILEKENLAVPATLDELDAAIKKLHDPDNGFYGFVARGQRAAAVTQLSSFLFAEGADFTNGDAATINSPEAVTAITRYGTWLKDYGPPGVLNMAWPQAMGIFAQGKAAFFTDISSIYNNATDPENSTIADKVGFAVLPAGPKGQKPFNITPMGLAMNKNSKNKDAAWEFMKWATSKEMVLKLQNEGNVGARASAWENATANTDIPEQLYEVLKQSNQLGVGHDRPKVINVGEARDIVGDAIVKAILGENVQAAADKANQDLQALMDKERK